MSHGQFVGYRPASTTTILCMIITTNNLIYVYYKTNIQIFMYSYIWALKQYSEIDEDIEIVVWYKKLNLSKHF